MIHTRIGLALGDLQKQLLAIGAAGPRILARALDRAATSGATAMTRAIAADTGIASKNVRREIVIDKAGLYSGRDPRVVIAIAGKRIPLIAFGARGPEPSRGKGRGVGYRLPTGRGRVGNAFIATMPAGHRGVFKRPGSLARKTQGPRGFTSPKTGQARDQSGRLPIIELFGPSLPHVFQKYVDPVFAPAAQESLTKNLIHELERELQKSAAPAA